MKHSSALNPILKPNKSTDHILSQSEFAIEFHFTFVTIDRPVMRQDVHQTRSHSAHTCLWAPSFSPQRLRANQRANKRQATGSISNKEQYGFLCRQCRVACPLQESALYARASRAQIDQDARSEVKNQNARRVLRIYSSRSTPNAGLDASITIQQLQQVTKRELTRAESSSYSIIV